MSKQEPEGDLNWGLPVWVYVLFGVLYGLVILLAVWAYTLEPLP